ncbi:conserved unknown protein [Ectocarpus siliculosus]|uniref:Fibronectin type-III domain-containing protein n=1 Tax=Ectocarpus siliculosus TaxID=2880 RepID=D7FHU9_ECTSI|nr:conserved unknown protein [Ectocarpus siliculosus]|eukprot:CBJ34147.1 conserved unknown protein [Ectocarpus siliculosus]
MYYALCEAEAADKGGKESLANSAEAVKSAKEGAGVVAVGSLSISAKSGSGSIQRSRKNEYGDGYSHAELSPASQLRFRGLHPRRRYVVSLCTESNSGTLSKVTVSEAKAHAEAPLITEVSAMPADRSAEAISLAVALESSGLVHFAVRRAADGLTSVASRDHTIVYRGVREVNGTSSSSSAPQQQLPRGDAAANAGVATGGVLETVEGLEPNATYEIFIATETTNSNGVYHAKSEPVLATTHPVPPVLLDARAHAADASSSALVVAVSLASLAEVHYALFPIPTTPDEDGLVEDTAKATPTGDERASNGQADGGGAAGGEVLTRGGSGGDGACSGDGWGSRNGNGAVDGRRDPSALNETLGIVASGVIPSTATAGMLLSAAEEDGTNKPVEVSPAGAAAATAVRSNGHPSLITASRSLEGSGLEVAFRVEGLQAAQAYSVCLFTETPNSNGLFGDVHELRPVSTHAPVPELALEKIACAVDCPGLNRDACWLEANKCGECVDGFDGKAGHVNSPCGKVASLTEDDIARITDRERRRTSEGEQASQYSEDPEIGNDGGINPTSDVAPPERNTILVTDGGDSNRSIGRPAAAPSQSRLLMGVPVAMGPNLTKFLYVEVPEDNDTQKKEGFDVEKTAGRLCEELHTGGDEGKIPACLSSLTMALKSRFADGRFHREDDPQRPVLQVEVDAPGGESLAFTLRQGEEEGIAVVGFCRDNEGVLPDEQACVVTLMQEMSL